MWMRRAFWSVPLYKAKNINNYHFLKEDNMASNINEESYEQTIQALNVFSAEISEAAQAMADQASECVEACEGDEASTNSQEKLAGCLQAFNAAAQQAQALARAMQAELEAAREAAAKAASV